MENLINVNKMNIECSHRTPLTKTISIASSSSPVKYPPSSIFCFKEIKKDKGGERKMNCTSEYLKTCTKASRECSLREHKPSDVIELWVIIGVSSVVLVIQLLEMLRKTIRRFQRRACYGSQLDWERVVAREKQKMKDVDMDVRRAAYIIGRGNFEIKAKQNEYDYTITDKLIWLYDRFFGFKFTLAQPQDTPTNVTPLLSANPAATFNEKDGLNGRSYY